MSLLRLMLSSAPRLRVDTGTVFSYFLERKVWNHYKVIEGDFRLHLFTSSCFNRSTFNIRARGFGGIYLFLLLSTRTCPEGPNSGYSASVGFGSSARSLIHTRKPKLVHPLSHHSKKSENFYTCAFMSSEFDNWYFIT